VFENCNDDGKPNISRSIYCNVVVMLEVYAAGN